MSAFTAKIWEGKFEGAGAYLGVPEKRYHEDPCELRVAQGAVQRDAGDA